MTHAPPPLAPRPARRERGLAFLLLAALALALPAGCRRAEEAGPEAAVPEPPPRPSDAFSQQFATPIERAHGLAAWNAKQALRGDMVATFGGRVRNQGTILFRTDSTASRFDFSDGTLLVFDGRNAWVSPSTSTFQRARYHLRAWPYLLAAPFKLRDHGVRFEDLGERELAGKTYAAAKLTFLEGAGDIPGNWMIAYRDPETDRLAAMAYIDAYGKSLEEAEREARAALFSDWVTVEGVTLPATLTVYAWKDGDLEGEPHGTVKFSNLEFVTPEPDAFARPDDALGDPVLPTI
ncbi:MAG TPA: hypothetical protein VF121_10705 [Thermoanaerobaculia bacterium]|nr:hypothetical protein [Thermoanaerobaculia bacterium]